MRHTVLHRVRRTALTGHGALRCAYCAVWGTGSGALRCAWRASRGSRPPAPWGTHRI